MNERKITIYIWMTLISFLMIGQAIPVLNEMWLFGRMATIKINYAVLIALFLLILLVVYILASRIGQLEQEGLKKIKDEKTMYIIPLKDGTAMTSLESYNETRSGDVMINAKMDHLPYEAFSEKIKKAIDSQDHPSPYYIEKDLYYERKKITKIVHKRSGA